MTTGLELPRSLGEALQVVREILKSNLQLVSQNRIDSEAEQCVMAAYRASTGSELTRVDFFLRRNDLFSPECHAGTQYWWRTL